MTNITPGHWYFQTVHPEYWWVTLCLSMLCTCISMLLKLLLVQKFTKDVSPNFPEIIDSYFARYSPVRGWLMAIFASDNFADSFTQSFLPIRTPNNSIHAMIVANQQLMIEWGPFNKQKATSTKTSDANQDDPFQEKNMCDDPVRFFRRFERRGRWPTAFGSLLFCWRGLFVSLLACLFVCLFGFWLYFWSSWQCAWHKQGHLSGQHPTTNIWREGGSQSLTTKSSTSSSLGSTCKGSRPSSSPRWSSSSSSS